MRASKRIGPFRSRHCRMRAICSRNHAKAAREGATAARFFSTSLIGQNRVRVGRFRADVVRAAR
jgi:hypothetical protein